VLIFTLLNKTPDIKPGSKIWSPDQLEVLCSISLIGAAPRAVSEIPSTATGQVNRNGHIRIHRAC